MSEQEPTADECPFIEEGPIPDAPPVEVARLLRDAAERERSGARQIRRFCAEAAEARDYADHARLQTLAESAKTNALILEVGAYLVERLP